MRPTAVPAVLTFLPSLAVYLAVGPMSLWLLPAAAASSLAYVLVFWRLLHRQEREDFVTHLPAPLRALLAA